MGANHVIAGERGLIFHKQNKVVGFRNYDSANGEKVSASVTITGALSTAGGTSAIDGPLPFGEIVGVVVVVGAVSYSAYSYLTDSDFGTVEEVYYHTPPTTLPGFPEAKPARRKNGRKRWIDRKGKIYEWDYQHGEVEVYDKTGKKHLGAYDLDTGKKVKQPVPGRTTPK